MRYEPIDDPIDFQRRTTALLVDEARHNLIRGVLGNLVDDRQAYDDHAMFVVATGDEAVAAALMTKPYNLILADAIEEAALAELVAGLLADSVPVPGAIGNRPTIEVFATLWEKATGESVSLGMEQGVFALDTLIPARKVPGAARIAAPSDAEVIIEWTNAFIDEALPDEPTDESAVRRSIERTLASAGPAAVWLWDVADRAVAMSRHGSPTGSGIRIGGVYTPPDERGNGWASALVAAQSDWLLSNGYDFCFLFTDLANPTSNAIYERIGYRLVAEGASYSFAAASQGT